MNQRELEYALAKQVPDMLNGCTIHTSYGDIVLDGVPGRLLAKHLELFLQEYLDELQDYERSSKTGMDRHGFSPDAPLIGGDYVHSAAELSAPDAQTISDVLVAQHAEVSTRLQSLHDQIASLHQTVCQPLSIGLLPVHRGSPDPVQPDGAPAAHTHCAAPSVPCAGLAPQPPVAPALAKAAHDLPCSSPKVD